MTGMRVKFFYRGKPVEVEGDFEITVNEQGISIKPMKAKESAKPSRKAGGARKWLPEEDKQLIELMNKGLKVDEIAAYLGRTPHSVSARLHRLKKKGIIPRPEMPTAE